MLLQNLHLRIKRRRFYRAGLNGRRFGIRKQRVLFDQEQRVFVGRRRVSDVLWTPHDDRRIPLNESALARSRVPIARLKKWLENAVIVEHARDQPDVAYVLAA